MSERCLPRSQNFSNHMPAKLTDLLLDSNAMGHTTLSSCVIRHQGPAPRAVRLGRTQFKCRRDRAIQYLAVTGVGG
jgi:hypothetical protein